MYKEVKNMSILHVTKDSFEAEVINSEKPVLLDFFATWCGPCRMLAPVLDQIAKETSDIKVVKVDVDEEPELAAKYEVMSVPTLFAFKDGKIINQTMGVVPKQVLLDLFS